MYGRNCWNCGHARAEHNFTGACEFKQDGETCDCRRYEDNEYLGHQRKRDLYTLSDRRRLTHRRAAR